MIITSQHDLKLYREAGELSTQILGELKRAVRSGVLPMAINDLAESLCLKHRVRPAFKGVDPENPYRFAACISVNDVVVHGIPSKTEPIKPGDIVKVDFGLVYQGFFTDHCFTVVVKPMTKFKEKLVKAARDSVQQAIPFAAAGCTTGDLGGTMDRLTQAAGFKVLKQYTGHSIGRSLHDLPIVPAFGRPGGGDRLEPGMVLCLESQVVSGSDEVTVASDGWSVKTIDGGLSAMFEYMVVVGRKRPILLTPTLDWSIIG